MTGSYDAALGAIAVCTGSPVDLADLDGIRDEPELVAALRHEGLGLVRVSERSRLDLAIGSAAESVALSDGRPDLILYSFELDHREEVDVCGEAAQLADGLNLPDVPVYTIGGQRCANFGPVLRTAVAQVRAGTSTHVLCVLAHRVSVGDRRMPGDIGVMSDGAASAVVTARPTAASGFGVRGTANPVRSELDHMTSLHDNPGAAQAFLTGIRTASSDLVAGTSAPVSVVVTSHHRDSAVDQLHRILRVPDGLLYRGAVHDYGHCHAADPLLSLWQLQRDDAVAPGRAVLVAASASSWWAMALLDRLT